MKHSSSSKRTQPGQSIAQGMGQPIEAGCRSDLFPRHAATLVKFKAAEISKEKEEEKAEDKNEKKRSRKD